MGENILYENKKKPFFLRNTRGAYVFILKSGISIRNLVSDRDNGRAVVSTVCAYVRVRQNIWV